MRHMTWTSQMQNRPASPTRSPGHHGDLLKGQSVSAYHDEEALWQIAYGAKVSVSATSRTLVTRSTHGTPVRTQEIDVLGAMLAPLDELFGHERARKPSNAKIYPDPQALPTTPRFTRTLRHSSLNQCSGLNSPPAHSPLAVSSGNRELWFANVGGAALRDTEPAHVGAISPGDTRGPALQLHTQNNIHPTKNGENRHVQNRVVLFQQDSPSSTPANQMDGDLQQISKPKLVFSDADLGRAREADCRSGNIDLIQQREYISVSPSLSLSQEHALLSQNNTPVATGHSTPDSSQGTDAFGDGMGPCVALFWQKNAEDEISLEQKIQDSKRLLSTGSWKTTNSEFL